MRLLDRYLLRELLIPLGYCLGGFLVFWITYDLFTELTNFQRYHLQPRDIAAYYAVKTPEMLVIVIPLALLLALLYALTNHVRHHELAAIRAAGVPLWRLTAPYFGVATALGAGLFALNEFAVPDGADRAEQILLSRGPAESTEATNQWQRGLIFFNAPEQRTWYIGAYHPPTAEMRKVHIEWRRPDGSRRQLSAECGVRTNGAWLFATVQEVVIPAGNELPPAPVRAEARLMEELTETPRLIQSEIKVSRLENLKTAKRTHLGVREIRTYLELHPQLEPRRRDWLETLLHHQLALPWTCVVVVLIALPFGAASGRRNVFVGVASSVFICFVYFVLRELSLALGGGGRVAPWLAAWAPNLVFGLAGLVLTWRIR